MAVFFERDDVGLPFGELLFDLGTATCANASSAANLATLKAAWSTDIFRSSIVTLLVLISKLHHSLVLEQTCTTLPVSFLQASILLTLRGVTVLDFT